MELLQYDFLRHALVAGLLASLVCGVIGSLVVVYRIVFLAGGIAHTAYGGVGMAFYFGFSPFLGTLGVCLASALALSGITLRRKHRSDAVVGALWAAGMAVGILFVDLTPGYRVDLMSTLFGSLLTVSGEDLVLMAGAAVTVLGAVSWYYQDFLALAYDEEYARTRGVATGRLHTLVLALTALAVVVLIRVVGLILVIALLTIPPYLAERRSRSLGGMMVRSTLASGVFVLAGLGLSYRYDLSSGATIILVASGAFLLDELGIRIRRRTGSPSEGGRGA